ncbi:SIMPL domain-containing protein [Paenibacillus alginolyticus]|uniref:SIMPL domain-containing protein n=1 Tax=Paenibacillus alginolyticus TaxID=59839 RepID=A0ABT4GHH2_9BACL|nr:SIMPL domain-containing protein [Paenibacillus alginolyticus]MCY9665480.1 SIMPL domain-containing protein [Paenibacillus alginolyticus]MCY9695620.1 SIMPL domain-containing protein [Paenibacillus alginolyticus]MEC0147410.1 SIMPL domain-containing protein [Paenibacillus alginolyticus]
MYNYPINKSASFPNFKCPPTIEVLGMGTAAAAPDRAVVVLGAVTEGPVLPAVQTENAKIITSIIQSLLKLNIPREKIQTHDFRIEIQYDYQEGKQIFRGYKVTHLLQIINDKVELTGILVDTAVSSGANNITDIKFTTSQPEIYENQALSLAIRNARQKAVTIANTLGVTLFTVPSQIQEIASSAEPIPYATAVFTKSAVTPIEPGQLTIYAKVRVWYMFADR